MLNIAIDGPAGAGKSTIARAVSKKLNIIYVDTGAMYRAMALYIIRQGIQGDNEEEILKVYDNAEISIKFIDSEQCVILNNENVTKLLRTEEIGNMASVVATLLPVREKIVTLQKDLAKVTDCIMDGRDIGTCVLPEASLKIYLTASSTVRAKRRYDELCEKSNNIDNLDFNKIKEDIEERDYRDMHREHSPLKQAPDATLIDSSDMTIDEVIQKIIDLCKNIEK